MGNATPLATLGRVITRLEEAGASDLIPDVEVLCDLKDRLVILAQECSSRTADAQAVARKRVREAVDGITVDVRDLRALGVSK